VAGVAVAGLVLAVIAMAAVILMEDGFQWNYRTHLKLAP
jgi:hypothetical protein